MRAVSPFCQTRQESATLLQRTEPTLGFTACFSFAEPFTHESLGKEGEMDSDLLIDL